MGATLNGTDNAINHGDVAGIDGASVLTFCFWAFVRTLETNAGFLSKYSGASAAFSFRQYDAAGAVQLLLTTGGIHGRVAGVLAINEWRHWAFVFNGGGAANADRLKIFRDGVEQTLTFSGTVGTTLGDAGAVPLRAGSDGAGPVFQDCIIADLKGWGAALTAAEVAQEMIGRPNRGTDLGIWCPYEDAAFTDFAGANAGTFEGTGTAADAIVTGAPTTRGGGMA